MEGFPEANEDFNTIEVDNSPIQPYMVCARLGSEKRGSWFVRLDTKFVKVADNAVTAFDILFKSHFVFNVQYASELQNFYNFICGCIYKIEVPNPSSGAFHSCLLNVPVEISM